MNLSERRKPEYKTNYKTDHETSQDECAPTPTEFTHAVTRYFSIDSSIALGFTVVTLGILSVVPMIHATGAAEVESGKAAIGEPFAPDG